MHGAFANRLHRHDSWSSGATMEPRPTATCVRSRRDPRLTWKTRAGRHVCARSARRGLGAVAEPAHHLQLHQEVERVEHMAADGTPFTAYAITTATVEATNSAATVMSMKRNSRQARRDSCPRA